MSSARRWQKATGSQAATSPDLLRQAYRTLWDDARYYQSKGRPVSIRRLWRFVTPDLQRPIFLIGAPRSGTSFLGQCLGRLPEISYHHEPVATKAASRHIYEGSWSFVRANWFYHQVYGWLMRIHLDGHLRFAEKTPRNCFIVPFLIQAFPDAQFVHIIRDGRDAALSYRKTPWLQAASANSGRREPGGYSFGPYPRFWVERERKGEFEKTSDIHRCIWAWKRFVESALAASTSLPGKQYFELRYENLVRYPQREENRLLERLDISDPASRQMFQEALEAIHPHSIGKWRDELSAEQIEVIQAEAGHLLRQLDYLD